MIKVYWFGYGGTSHLAEELRSLITDLGMELITVHEWDNSDVKWQLNTWLDEIKKADIIILPLNYKEQPAKSNNRLTQAFSIGKPVICSPLDAYVRIHNSHPGCCLFAETTEQWRDHLIKLRDNEDIRKELSEKALEAGKDYSVEAMAKKWLSVLPIEKSKPKISEDSSAVDIIISNYDNLPYLKLCVDSIVKNTEYPYRLIISDAGSGEETWKYLRSLQNVIILGEPSVRLNFSESCNAGIQSSNSKYFVILNSDVIVSKGWLSNLVQKMDSVGRLALCGVLSNCDRGWLHGVTNRPSYPMKLEKANVELMPGMKLDTIEPHLNELYEFMEKSNEAYKGKFEKQDWIAAYAMICARSAFNEIGFFDPEFQNGCEDHDLCRRLRLYKYEIGQAIDTFVFHFGGISRAAYETSNRDKFHEEDMKNHELIKKKWGKENIVIWTGPALEPWNKEKVDSGMAGSETWAAYMARAFVKRGYFVTIYNDLLSEDKTQPVLDPVYDLNGNLIGNVVYRHCTEIEKDIQYRVIHYMICSRVVEPLRRNLHSVKNYIMVHDIWLSSDKNFDIMPWRINKYGYLSEWHKEFLIQHHNMPEDKMFLTSNGVDIENYQDVDFYQKKNQAVYSSSPDRGLYQLLKMIPGIRKDVPDFELYVCYGFYNWEKKLSDDASRELISKIKSLLEQDGVIYKGRVSKRDLALLQMESKVWLYPTWFWETQNCTSIENGLSKCALLSTDLAGHKTTIGDSGMLLSPEGLTRDSEYPESFTKRFIEEAVRLLKDEEYRKIWANKAYNKMKNYTWDKVAEGWIKEFKLKE